MAGEVAYARIREGVVARTVEVSDTVNVDVDDRDLILGVELLDGGDWRDALASLAMEGRLAVPRKDPDGLRAGEGLPGSPGPDLDAIRAAVARQSP
jgi:uncharacterized protein YuzE